ncbi:Protein of unknown function [Pyronema omphalodes CBS 100304]|uniref:Uncharacterized protein n=1 Tax=Pyronema omphalodes (strain CBS 100304) TaxID=1076935 RepID=U4L0S0_PYROM|nr:Protein of unknown function [Pyronema omphalodes CBS 100304]
MTHPLYPTQCKGSQLYSLFPHHHRRHVPSRRRLIVRITSMFSAEDLPPD